MMQKISKTGPVRRIVWQEKSGGPSDVVHSYEWLVSNGLGGYASGTVSGIITRRYHGLLIAAMPVPLGRMVMLNGIAEEIRPPDLTSYHLLQQESLLKDAPVFTSPYLKQFRLESGLPIWRYEIDGFVVEKQVLLPYGQNTVHIIYRLVEGEGKLRLRLRPAINFRHHETAVDQPLFRPYIIKAWEDRFEIYGDRAFPSLRLFMHGERTAFTIQGYQLCRIYYSAEESRGYSSMGEMWCPGFFRADLEKNRPATLVASTENWETLFALQPEVALKAELGRRERLLSCSSPMARVGLGDELILAADQFIITPSGRTEDAARARAAGDDIRSVIAGYHWFTDWGRDTMISLEGLALITGRHAEAGFILRTFSHYIREGLIPNMFPEGKSEGLYNTADATLWFFHAVDRYLEATGDEITLRSILPELIAIIDHHRRGTLFGIGADPEDGLLSQGQEGFALTWMDAKVDGWVVTPRRGKAVEINALWYNALHLLETWVEKELGKRESLLYRDLADKVKESFNRRFWYDEGGYLYDLVDGEQGDDSACRPNQIFAISLRHPVLNQDRWEAVVNMAREQLLTPVGLRSLAPGHPDYKPQYYGDLRARDAAYHQGTVWAWLIGPFIDAWLKVYPDRTDEASHFLDGFNHHLDEAGIGSISEVFDAEHPFTPRGCIAQAWSVAEVLRSLILAGDRRRR